MLGKCLLRRAQLLHQLAIAHADQRDLDRDLRELRKRLREDVDAFLVREAAHDRRERHFVRPLEAHALLQGPFIGELRIERIGAVARGDERIDLRIPDVGVDAVQHAEEILRPVAQHAVHPEAQLVRLDLARVGGAHRVHRARIHDAALEERDLAVVLGALQADAFRRKLERLHLVEGEDPLEGEIVDREERRGVASARKAQIKGRQRRRPVVAMHHVRAPFERACFGS